MHQHRSIHALAAAATVVGMMTGCGTEVPDLLAHAEQVADSCPTGSRVAALVQSDESGTSRGESAGSVRQAVIRQVAERVAICGGHLRVAVFAGSMIGVTAFDSELHLDGATAIARLRKAPKVVAAALEQVNAALPAATAALTDDATDIVGQYQHGAEYVAQLSATGPVVLEQTILTDGIQTSDQDLSDTNLTDTQAATLAATVTVPDLTGAVVRLIGIGRQADGEPLSTQYIAALRTFHAAVCERTGAHCTVVTDAAGA